MNKIEFYKMIKDFHLNFGGNEFSTFCDFIYSSVVDGTITEYYANTLNYNEYKNI